MIANEEKEKKKEQRKECHRTNVINLSQVKTCERKRRLLSISPTKIFRKKKLVKFSQKLSSNTTKSDKGCPGIWR
jgi:hypothetical protein